MPEPVSESLEQIISEKESFFITGLGGEDLPRNDDGAVL
jgi:hypothetical protein